MTFLFENGLRQPDFGKEMISLWSNYSIFTCQYKHKQLLRSDLKPQTNPIFKSSSEYVAVVCKFSSFFLNPYALVKYNSRHFLWFINFLYQRLWFSHHGKSIFYTTKYKAYVGREIDTHITLGVSTSQWARGRIPLIWWLSTWPQHGLNPDYEYCDGNSLYSFLTPQHQMLLSSQGCSKPWSSIGNTYICSSAIFSTQIWSSITICWFQNLYLF